VLEKRVLQNSVFDRSVVPRQAAAGSTAPRLGALHRQRESLMRFIESISAELALQPLLTQIIRLACDLIDADKGTVGLYDASRNVFRTEAIWNMGPTELGAEMPPGVGLAGQLMVARQPVILERYGDVERPIGGGRQLDDAVIGLPIDLDGEMIGYLGIGMASPAPGVAPRRRFTEADARALGVFARHAAIALRNARRFEAERRRAALFELVAGIAHIITADLRPAELLQNAADAIHQRFGYPNVAIGLIEPLEPGVLVIRALSGRQKEIEQAGSWSMYRIPISDGITGAAVREKRPIIVNNVASDPRYIRMPNLDEVTADLAVPILLAGRVLGVLNVESAESFADDDAAALEIVAGQLAIAIENARLYDQAQRLAILEERQRLARELHDSVTQQIFGITLLAESLDPVWRRNAHEGEARAQKLLRLSRAALAEMRALLAELRPADADPFGGRTDQATWIGRLRKTGLVATLRSYLSGAELGSTMVQLDADSYTPQSEQLETVLYRIAREALHNVVKHARASRLEVRLVSDGATARLTILDDGRGFDAAAVQADTAHAPGFASMTEHACAVGGEIRIEASPGRGARVEAILPTRTGD
jgi:signal transduction histidine kinase